MINLKSFDGKGLNNIKTACAYLFSPEYANDLNFIKNIGLADVKKAFRSKVKKYHPDLRRNDPHDIIIRGAARFNNIKQSYNLLTSNILEKVPGKIIAIGGAKGGIGKSMFAANLGVYLSNMGYETAVVDLDLGGANLHLYLGETALDKKINDFLLGDVPSINDIMIKSKYGPHFIGGDSSQLGIANISFSVKMKLFKAIKNIDKDYIIIDLGGDTTFNIIDFFLSADFKIVMTTREPASYLDAYRFIKVSLYRKLNRLFGVESEYRKLKDDKLTKLIYEATMESNGSQVRSINELIEKITRDSPNNLSLIKKVIANFNPHLIINKIPKDFNTNRIASHIRNVSEKSLSLTVQHIGNISYQPEIERSSMELIPVISKFPNGVFSTELNSIVNKLLYR